MERPALKLPTTNEETFAGVTYHIDGELVPVLTVELEAGNSIFFEHHILLWKEPSVTVGLRAMAGAIKRMMAGIQIFLTEAKGPGQIGFSRDGTGHIIALHFAPGDELHVREHQFLAATNNIDYAYERVRGISNILFGGTGYFIDKFRSPAGEGILWLHGYGNIFEKELADGEQIDIEPGGWLYKDACVKMDTNVQRISTGLLAGMNLMMNRFTGPGRIGLQSMYMSVPGSDTSK